MDDALVGYMIVSADDLVHEVDGLALGQVFFITDGLGEVPSIAQLGDDVGVVLCGVDVVDFDDVLGALQGFQHLNLRGEQVFMHLSFDHLHVDDLDGDRLI